MLQTEVVGMRGSLPGSQRNGGSRGHRSLTRRTFPCTCLHPARAYPLWGGHWGQDVVPACTELRSRVPVRTALEEKQHGENQ